MYLFNELTEGHTLIQNDSNIPHVVTADQSNTIQGKHLVRNNVSDIFKAKCNKFNFVV